MNADTPTIRYATLSGPKLGHLLPRSWPASNRKGRPSLCELWRRQWIPVERLDDPAGYHACPDCSAAAGIVPAAPTPLIPEARGHSNRSDLPLDVPHAVVEFPPGPAHARIGADHRINRVPYLAGMRTY